MRIWKPVFVLALSAFVPMGERAFAQGVVSPTVGRSIILTNRAALRSGVSNAITPRDVTPALGPSNVTPAIGRPGITPAIANPAVPSIVQTQRFTTGIGRQGFGGAIGQQGSGTAIGQQGSGTAIGQQGSGTAIIPPNTQAPAPNGVVIGQPEPFQSAAPATAPRATAPGFAPNLPNQFGQRTLPGTNSAIRPTMPTPVKPSTVLPSGRTLTPTGRR
jgi:hypothetical protein